MDVDVHVRGKCVVINTDVRDTYVFYGIDHLFGGVYLLK